MRRILRLPSAVFPVRVNLFWRLILSNDEPLQLPKNVLSSQLPLAAEKPHAAINGICRTREANTLPKNVAVVHCTEEITGCRQLLTRTIMSMLGAYTNGEAARQLERLRCAQGQRTGIKYTIYGTQL